MTPFFTGDYTPYIDPYDPVHGAPKSKQRPTWANMETNNEYSRIRPSSPKALRTEH
jgi:hypothetical protein